MQINSWFFSYCGGLSFQSNPIFKSYCKRHNGLICWFLSSKVPKKKRLNFEFDFNHWVLYVRLAKRTDFSIIDPKKTFFHPFQGIYCNYYEKIRQKCDLVIFFDWGVIWLIWLYLSMYFSTPNMVKWVIPEKILQNAVQMCWPCVNRNLESFLNGTDFTLGPSQKIHSHSYNCFKVDIPRLLRPLSAN